MSVYQFDIFAAFGFFDSDYLPFLVMVMVHMTRFRHHGWSVAHYPFLPHRNIINKLLKLCTNNLLK